jgi:2-dehydro-3-deoxyphosphogluconate aldolase/(4S)-4-hydroxy-2-oxoglutarate aldolase
MEQNNLAFSWKKFEEVPIVGIIRGVSLEDFKQILPMYLRAGLTTVEVTMNTPDVESLIRFAATEYAGVLNVGAGTVCNLTDLEKALSYGAQFIVTPVLNEEVIQRSVAMGIPVFPGALTPSEIYKAWSLGAEVIKVFPAGYLGANYLKEIKAPLDKIKMLPTGGISLSNMQSFLDLGVSGLGIGSPLFDKTLIQAKDWIGLENHFAKYVEVFRNKNLTS